MAIWIRKILSNAHAVRIILCMYVFINLFKKWPQPDQQKQSKDDRVGKTIQVKDNNNDNIN